mmetsp:Transcript_68152/g.118613  ORF Transcript_68152/g.118613 Transcript_68152/m.118613 type:complete len:272 (-) Transcript_68152:50-865(-)
MHMLHRVLACVFSMRDWRIMRGLAEASRGGSQRRHKSLQKAGARQSEREFLLESKQLQPSLPLQRFDPVTGLAKLLLVATPPSAWSLHPVSVGTGIGFAQRCRHPRICLAEPGMLVAWQNLVDRGEAETLKDAQHLLASKANAAALQNMVKRGEARDIEDAKKLRGLRLRKAAYKSLIDKGQAKNEEEAMRIGSQRALKARTDAMLQGGVTWEIAIHNARLCGESKRTRPRKFPCPLGCGYMFTSRQKAKRHADSPTACPCKMGREANWEY